MKNKIYYIFDPLCGWCYGFSPVIKKLEEQFGEEISFETICGGMVLGERVQPIAHMRDYLKEAIPRLEEMTGVKFGQAYMDILEEGKLALSSEIPSIAMLVFKSMSIKSPVTFASALQKELYEKGHNLNLLENYESLVKEFNIDWEVFQEKMKSESYKQKAYEEFKISSQMGIQGFPSVVFQTGKEAYLIARGYRPFEEMTAVIEQIKKKEETA